MKQLQQNGHQRAKNTNNTCQSQATRSTHKSPNGAITRQINMRDHEGQLEVVVRPKQSETTEELQEQKSHKEILSVYIDDTQKSTYTAKVGSTEATALFDSSTSLSCISKRFYNRISCTELSKVIDTNAGPVIVVTTASDDEFINLGQCRLCIKLGEKTFEYYFQILKNLKQDLILGLNFQRMFKILQDITDNNDLYLHIRRKIIIFSQQAKNITNHISTHKCMQIKPQSFKQFQVKAPKGLKNGAVYKIDYNTKGIPENVIPVLDTFIVGKLQKLFGITVINQSDDVKWIPQGQHIGTVHLVEGRTPSKEEAQEIIHELRVDPQEVDELNSGSTDDFITNNDQVQTKRLVQHQEKQKLSPEMKKKLDNIINEYSDIFSKDQYDIGTSTHPPVEIPMEGPPCISTPYTIPLKFRPWADNTINKLLEVGMIQHTMSTWASPVIIVPKKGLELPNDPGTPLQITAKLRMVCDYRKLNKKLPPDFWSYDKDGRRISNHGIKTPYPLPRIDEMLASIRGLKFLMTLDCTGVFHGLRLSPDAAKKSTFITHLGKFEWKVAPFGLALLPSYYSKAMQDMLSGLEDFTRNYMDNILIASYTEKEHLDHITQVFKCFHKFKMKLKLTKCEFSRGEIQFLGNIINHKGIRTLPEKTEEILKIKVPRNAYEVRAFLGLLNYYRQFIPAFLDLMHPIQKLLKKNVKFEWTEECSTAFKTAKETLMRDPIL